MQGGSAVSVSPSFNTYSSAKLAEIAARVVKELGQEPDPDDDIFSWAAENPPLQPQETSNAEPQREEDEDEDEDEFEFAVVCREPEYSSPISADEIFYNGQIRPIYPIFDQTLLLNDSHTNPDNSKASLSTFRRSPLRKLMVEEREREQQEEAREPMSCSSSEADDLDGVQPGTYCVWTPTKPSSESAAEASLPAGRRKKSLSTGSSKRWKLRDLLYRSNSDGKDTFVFVTPSKKAEKTVAVASKVAPQQLDAHYVRNSAAKEEDHKRRSYLPYRKDLVGFFANMNGLNRSLQPF
jgi:hypothetical protein